MLWSFLLVHDIFWKTVPLLPVLPPHPSEKLAMVVHVVGWWPDLAGQACGPQRPIQSLDWQALRYFVACTPKCGDMFLSEKQVSYL